MGDAVELKRSGGVCTLALNRPERFNALDLEMGDALVAAVAVAAADPGVHVLVLTGAGPAFCAGGDLRFFQNWEGPPSGAFGALTQRLHRVICDLRQMSKPVIAAINGAAGGAGFSLAMACDLRLAADTARFKQAYTAVGLVPDGGWTFFVARQVGLARAAELVLLDPVLDAQQALSLGLVNQVLPAAELPRAAAQLAERLAAGPTLAFARAKALLNQSLLSGLEAQLEAERQAIMAAGGTEDFQEGLSAFFGKRAPNFTGR